MNRLSFNEVTQRAMVIKSLPERHPEQYQFLCFPCSQYLPDFLSIALFLGIEDIYEHLVLDHGYSWERIRKMRPDSCYRIHDLIHRKAD